MGGVGVVEVDAKCHILKQQAALTALSLNSKTMSSARGRNILLFSLGECSWHRPHRCLPSRRAGKKNEHRRAGSVNTNIDIIN